MDVPYQWYSNSQHVPAYYPSPTPSSDPSPTPRPHQTLDDHAHAHAHYLAQSFDQIQSNVGPERVLRKSRAHPEHTADRFSDAVYLQVTPPYQPGSPSSMASPYSPYDCSQRPRSRSMDAPDFNMGEMRFPDSPAPSLGSAESSLSNGSTSHHRSEAHHPPVPKPKHTKNRLRDVDRKNICLFHIQNKHVRQEDIGTKFGVERSTISKVLKEKDKWLKISPEAEANNQTTKHRPSKFPEIEEVLVESLQHWTDRKINITDQLIRQKGLEIARSYHITTDRFKGSSGWVENFKQRQHIRRGEWLKARRIPEPAVPIKQVLPHVIPDTPVIKPYDTVAFKPIEHVEFDVSRMPPPEPRKRRGLPAPPIPWPPLERRLAAERAAAEAEAAAAAERAAAEQAAQQQQEQPALVLDPALQDGPAVTSPLETAHTHTQHQHGAYENGMGMMYGSPSASGANINNGPSNPASTTTCQEAENALKVVISFLESDGRDIVKDSDRDALHQIRGAINQWSNRMYGTA